MGPAIGRSLQPGQELAPKAASLSQFARGGLAAACSKLARGPMLAQGRAGGEDMSAEEKSRP